MSEDNQIVVNALKAECHDIQHKIDLLELKIKNYSEAKELKLERIDRIECGGDSCE